MRKREAVILLGVALMLTSAFTAYAYWTERLSVRCELPVCYPVEIHCKEMESTAPGALLEEAAALFKESEGSENEAAESERREAEGKAAETETGAEREEETAETEADAERKERETERKSDVEKEDKETEEACGENTIEESGGAAHA